MAHRHMFIACDDTLVGVGGWPFLSCTMSFFDRIRFNHANALLKAPFEPYATLLQVCYKPKVVIAITALLGVRKWMH